MRGIGKGGSARGKRFKVLKHQKITKNLLVGRKKIGKSSRAVFEQLAGRGAPKFPSRTFFKIPSILKKTVLPAKGESSKTFNIAFSQLERFNRSFPQGFSLDSLKVQNYFLHQARLWQPQINFPRDAWVLWDQVVRQFGFGSLEDFVLFHHGYLAATFLPQEYRKNIIPGEESFRNVSTYPGFAKRQEQLKDRALEHVLVSQYPPILALKIAEFETDFPEWKGLLKPEYFDRTPGGSYPLNPSPTVAWGLWKLAVAANRENFPKLSLKSSKEQGTLEGIRNFFTLYRNGERLILDGGKDDVHCGFSSFLVCNLLQTLGFTAFPVNVFRSLMAPEKFFKYGFYLDRLARHLGTSPAGARLAVLEWERDGLSDEVLQEQSERFETSVKNIQGSYRFFLHLSESDRDMLGGKSGRGHTVTAFRNENIFYLLDINGQQFGPEFDRLEFLPGEEASENGFLLYAPLEGIWRSRGFADRVKSLSAYFRASQKIVRLYLDLLPRIPSRDRVPQNIKIQWPLNSSKKRRP